MVQQNKVLSKIKVLYIIDTLEPGGAEKSLIEISQNFRKITPIFVSIYSGEALKDTLLNFGIKLYQLNIQEKYGYSKAANLLNEIVQDESPDIIHASLFRSCYISRKLKKHLNNIPLVNSLTSNSYKKERFRSLTFHRNLKLNYIFLLDKMTSSKVDLFISNSQTIKKSAVSLLNISEDKIAVIYRGRHPELFNRKKSIRRNTGECIFLNVGRLIESKGQLELIKAFSKIVDKFPKCILQIAGEGPLKGKIQDEINNLNLNSSIKLLGYVEDIPQLLNSSDYFVFPSHLEGLPGSIIEAMFSKTPIICSNIDENLECVSSESALIFPVGNINELASKMEKAISSDNSHRINLAFKYAQAKFNVRNIASDYEKAYLNLL